MDEGTGRATNKLTDRKVKAFIAAKAIGKKLSDGGSLHLAMTPGGKAVWRVRYRHDGDEQTYTIGGYPEIGLQAARAERDRAKALIREGRDPVDARRLQKAKSITASGNTFEAVAKDWLAKKRKDWSAIHYDKSSRALERDVYPALGKLPVPDIAPAMVAGVIKGIENRGRGETARKVLWLCSGVFQWAQAHGVRDDNPAEPVREVLQKKRLVAPRPAVLDFPGLGDILRRAEAANLSRAVRMAHRLCTFSMARISNIVAAEWREFDLDGEVPAWIIPRKKMKAQDRHHDHKVVLCPVIVDELRQWRSLVGPKGYLFPRQAGGGKATTTARKPHISRESLEKAYRVTLGLEGRHSPHGWRAAFSTLARDHGFERDAVELALDHIHDNEVARAYDRGERLKERIRLVAWWGDELTKAQRGGDIVKLHKAVA